MTVLGKFPKSKLAIVAGSLLSVFVISGIVATPQTTGVDDPLPAADASPAPDSQAAPAAEQRQIIRRFIVIRRAPSTAPSPPPEAAPAPAAPPPEQPAAPPPAVQSAPVTRSRGS